MGSSNILTIFSEPTRSRSFPSSFVVSALVHAGVLSLAAISFIESRRIIERFPSDRFFLRVVDVHGSQPQARQASGGIAYPGPAGGSQHASQAATGKAASSGTPSPAPALTQQTAHLMPAPQTLIQPDAPKNAVLPQKTPVPLIVLWDTNKVVVRRPVPPLPQKPVIADVRPTLDTAIKEENLAEFKLASKPIASAVLPTPPSTTTPVTVHGPEPDRKVPQTTSKPPETQTPTPARILSLSDVRVKDGSVAVPLANQASPKDNAGLMVPGVLKDPSAAGAGTSTAHSTSSGASQTPGAGASAKTTTPGQSSAQQGSSAGSGANHDNAASANLDKAPGQGNGKPAAQNAQVAHADAQNDARPGAAAGAAQGPAAGGTGNQPGTVHISLPRDGQFSVVVVGSSIAEQYPETAELWSGRMASTVYLRVGLPKSWILQYTLPRLVEASGGGKLEAPWPFELVRPNLDLDEAESDAVILHGFVNKDGRFEKLEVVFPPRLVQSAALVNVLNQWQFRPAKLNGAMTAVEVLLIIPDQAE